MVPSRHEADDRRRFCIIEMFFLGLSLKLHGVVENCTVLGVGGLIETGVIIILWNFQRFCQICQLC